jgi:8-oxo-dGTP pyrophosphatase MutT (NUDIX family)
LHVPFVARRPDAPAHGGQIALPGGRLRPGESAWEAAAREAEEEIGVRRSALVPLGAGDVVYAASSNHSVVPFVAWLPTPDVQFRPDLNELVGVLEVPLWRLLDPSAWLSSALGRYLPLGEARIWGLTARILADLLPRIRAALVEDA